MSRLLDAARRRSVDATPVWFMRQAGRALPGYRALRARYGFLEIATQPALAAEVSLEPVRLLGVDAAILFADIALPFLGLGIEFDVVDGAGPVVHHPVRSRRDLDRLTPLEPAQGLPFLAETVRGLRGALGQTPLIGFAGGPFTLAAYLVEGRASRDLARFKALLLSDADLGHDLLARLAEATIRYLDAQADAGADVLQIFDSWAGVLAPDDYARFAAPYTRTVIEGLRSRGLPIVHFAVGATALLEEMVAAGGDVIGVDWRQPLDTAWERIGPERGIQGNLDPSVLLAPPAVMAARARDVLRRAAGRAGHIFNLGHGVLPQTPVGNLQRLVEVVHTYRGDEEEAAWARQRCS